MQAESPVCSLPKASGAIPWVTSVLRLRAVRVKVAEKQVVGFTFALTGRDGVCFCTQGAASLYPGLCRSWAFSPPICPLAYDVSVKVVRLGLCGEMRLPVCWPEPTSNVAHSPPFPCRVLTPHREE